MRGRLRAGLFDLNSEKSIACRRGKIECIGLSLAIDEKCRIDATRIWSENGAERRDDKANREERKCLAIEAFDFDIRTSLIRAVKKLQTVLGKGRRPGSRAQETRSEQGDGPVENLWQMDERESNKSSGGQDAGGKSDRPTA
jgi:hypothetical protein